MKIDNSPTIKIKLKDTDLEHFRNVINKLHTEILSVGINKISFLDSDEKEFVTKLNTKLDENK